MVVKMTAIELEARAILAARVKKKGVTRLSDATLGWMELDHPQLTTWRELAVEWLKGETRGVYERFKALLAFFERYIVRKGLPIDPAIFLLRTTVLPEFYQTACPDSAAGVKYNNAIHAFLNFVLLRRFSEEDDSGRPIISPAFHNPVPRMSRRGLPSRNESVHSPLPYGYLDELRQMLAEGEHFRDWQWAQAALGSPVGQSGYVAPDWFQVTEDQVDPNDPDCVWRVRSRAVGARLEMWSPVRWVALLTKLILPLRTFQVRMLDSGEADTWRLERGQWVLNSNRLAHGNEGRPFQQGVFRRNVPLATGDAITTLIYVNTNKTDDVANGLAAKGYVLPWFSGEMVHQNVFFWLEKLRNWQEKYNPISRRTSWAELDSRHICAKSDIQLAGYPDSCFLFRMPEAGKVERHLPIRDGVLDTCWFPLLRALEGRLANRGETHRKGTPITLVPPTQGRTYSKTTLFPLHSLRVSLITALALEGQVPFPVLQKLVGHSRLLMTLYYTKPGATRIHEALFGAAARLEANKEASILRFLLDTRHEDLLQQAICNSVSSLAAALPEHPAARNSAGWMPMHHGLCMVGGNTSEVEDNGAIGGCYNGGVLMINSSPARNPRHGPVPGGSRNCVRCRWFVTEPHHLPALVAHFNTVAYHFDEARNACLSSEDNLQELKRQKADAEDAGQIFALLSVYRNAERLWESAMKRFSDLAEDLVACWRLIERCKAALEASDGAGTQLLAAGEANDIQIVFEETESELLQLVGVCQNVEVYPDLDGGKAVFRRSQLLDAALYRDRLPPMFMLLGEKEQLLAGNEFMRRLAQQMDPENPALGQRKVIRLMDAGMSLSQHFDVDLGALLPSACHGPALPSVSAPALEVKHG